MITEVAPYFAFEPVFKHGQKKTELGDDMDLLSIHLDSAINSGWLKNNGVIIPAIFDIEFICQVLRQLVGGFLSVFTTHVVMCMDVDGWHGRSSSRLTGSSLVPGTLFSQPMRKPVLQ